MTISRLARLALSLVILYVGLAFVPALPDPGSGVVYVGAAAAVLATAGAIHGRWTALVMPVGLVLALVLSFLISAWLEGELLDPDAHGSTSLQWILGAYLPIGLIAAVPATACTALGVALSKVWSRRRRMRSAPR